jgi:two-component system LytT family response regulator
MKMLQVIIVDDEPLARSRVRRMLQGHTDVEIIAECSNGKQAIEAVRKHKPDLLLLDVEMPEMDGFEVVDALGKDLPYIVFITAYNQYAIRAFEVHALDYLLKPFNESRLTKAFERARDRIRDSEKEHFNERIIRLLEDIRGESHYMERLILRNDRKIWFMNVNQIDWFEADGKYVNVHAGKEAHLVRESLTSLESKLDPKNFARIHRSSIVNINRIKEFQPWFHGDYRILLKDGTELILSRTYRKQFRDLIGE